MKVLTMQLNSIAIMDLIAYGGAALGAILAVTQFRAGRVDLAGCIMILLLAADFFLPMRLLGSYFHIAMNGMAASDKIFRLLDLPEPEQKIQCVPQDPSICMEQVCFSYQPGREVRMRWTWNSRRAALLRWWGRAAAEKARSLVSLWAQ